ncbi:MAG: META domain-containing protein [Chloroflexota bacterium]|jgi:uncharacterized lipoprotein YbaY/heat shock protein HslJ
MRKISLVLILAALALLAAACAGAEPTEAPAVAPEPTEAPALAPAEEPTAEPTREPAAEPTEEPTSEPTDEPTVEPPAIDSAILDTSWRWLTFQDPSGQDNIAVADSDSYTLTLRPGGMPEGLAAGTAAIQADCNQVSWAYTLAGNSLTFDASGPSTLAFCGDESLDQQFLALLGSAATYIIDDNRDLVLTLADDAGTMIFTPVGDLSAEADQPVGPGPEEAMSNIVGVTWLWQAFQDQAQENDIVVLDPEKYSLTLQDDGTAAIQADCNRVNWSYTLEAGNLTFNTTGPSTLAFCGEDSLDQQFLTLLGNAVTFVVSDGDLVLNLMADAGNMVFAAPSLTGAIWQWENFVTPVGIIEDVAPGQYTLRFNDDGTVNIKADCNQAGGTFTNDETGFAIDLGPTTLAECGPDSLSDDFLSALRAAAVPFFLDGKLYIDLFADGGTMRFGAPGGAAVTGTVTYLQRIALPPDAVVEVQIRDTSLADAPAETIGLQVIQTNGRQVPFPFVVRYNPAVIVDNHTYTLFARITDGQGNLLFISDTAVPVITNGNPADDVEIVLTQVG